MEALTLFLIIFFINLYSITYALDTISSTVSLRDGETLVSSGGRFELGFFSPGSSTNRYIGIWYRNTPDKMVVWVANREDPIRNTTGAVLKVMEPGILVLATDTNGIIWSSNNSRQLQNPIAQLLDSGNLVVRDATDERPENFAWQGFDYPTDTLLPGMSYRRNLITGFETYLVSWRGVDDPAPGEYIVHLDPTGFGQVLITRANVTQFRFGPWLGVQFTDQPRGRSDGVYTASFVMNQNEVSYREDSVDNSLMRTTMNLSGTLQKFTWVDGTGWVLFRSHQMGICSFEMCGVSGICNMLNSPPCGCLDRFVPKNPDGWADWGKGCVRRRNLSCQGDVFFRYSGIRLPDTKYAWYNINMTLDGCKEECARNCSCMAYTQFDIGRKSGCIWYKELTDMQSGPRNGQDIYIRMASSESDRAEGGRKTRQVEMASLTSAAVVLIAICLSILIYIRKMKNTPKTKEVSVHAGSYDEDSELPVFDLSVVLAATDNFSVSNKIGEGGFGAVYKGILEEGQEIAVKRLAKDSTQGLNEFKNEVVFIAKLQHRNLVRLLGCCIGGEESMLIYEYMPNKSLDVLIFDQTERMWLDWPQRFHIIDGIARGLLYLHEDSRLRIIHRDLKASNVLLDSEMNPKISDFGTARSFGGNETAAKTCKVVGTYGYMAPEYAMDGLFSVKSDVYSFGVILLEIVCGVRNKAFTDHNFNLLGHAWTLHREGRSLELLDASIADNSLNLAEVLRSVHVGLLCVQPDPKDRPSMRSVVLMLGNEGVLPEAKQPGFFARNYSFAPWSSTSTDVACSIQDMTITLLDAR